MMFVLQFYRANEELLMACMKDIVLMSRLAGTSSSVAALPASFTDCPVHYAMDALARLAV